MAPVHYIALALTLAATLHQPSSALPDRYVGNTRPIDPAPAPGVPPSNPDRPKRAYTTWKDYQVFSRWKPPLYQLNRPYFIPTYGAADRVPIFFPPQRLNLNPGTPLDNPLPNRPFKGPWYLPPTSEKPTTMKIDNRFNFDDDDDERDRPVWDSSPVGKEEEIAPTRPPRPPGSTDVPPLVHDVSGGSNQLAAESEKERPASSFRVTTTAVPTGPSNCVWAIVTCCSVSSAVVSDNCFEQRGCPGPFWGSSPCESDYAKAAIAAALNYYGNNK